MNYFSKTDDVVWLAYKLKEVMGSNVSINKFGLYKEVLVGKYSSNDCPIYKGIDFEIKYSKDEFLRLTVGEIMSYKSYEEKIDAINNLSDAISKIVNEEPIVFYNVSIDEHKTPYYDWAFTNKKEYIKEFVDGTVFDDAKPLDLIIFDEKNNSKVKTMK